MFFFSKIKVLHLEMVVLGLYWFPAFDESSMNIPFTAVYNSSYIAMTNQQKGARRELDRKRKSNQLFPAQVIYVEELFFYLAAAAYII
jgi:hypothetical protein